MWTVGDMVSGSSSSERSAMLTEFRSAMSSTSSSPVSEVSVLPRALSLLPMLGSIWTSMPHIFQSTFRVQVPALLLSGFGREQEPSGGETKAAITKRVLRWRGEGLLGRTCLQKVAQWSSNRLHMYHQGQHLWRQHRYQRVTQNHQLHC